MCVCVFVWCSFLLTVLVHRRCSWMWRSPPRMCSITRSRAHCVICWWVSVPLARVESNDRFALFIKSAILLNSEIDCNPSTPLSGAGTRSNGGWRQPGTSRSRHRIAWYLQGNAGGGLGGLIVTLEAQEPSIKFLAPVLDTNLVFCCRCWCSACLLQNPKSRTPQHRLRT